MRISDWISDVCSSDLVAVGQHRIGADQATLLAALADRLAIEAAAVVADFQHDFRTLAAHRDADRTFLGFLRLAALLARLPPARPLIAQHVPPHLVPALEPVAVHSSLRAAQPQLHPSPG